MIVAVAMAAAETAAAAAAVMMIRDLLFASIVDLNVQY